MLNKFGRNSSMMVILAGLFFFVFTSVSLASFKEMKKYNEVYPDAQLKCADCHVGKPSKEAPDLNDYGKAVLNAIVNGQAETTAETYNSVGKIEDFKK